MKTYSDSQFAGFSHNCRGEFQRTKEYLAKSSLKSFSTASRSASSTSAFLSTSFDHINSSGALHLSLEPSSSHFFDFYFRGKAEIAEIRHEFDKIHQLSKRSRKVTFGVGESPASKLNNHLGMVSRRIGDCDIAIRENGAIFSIDKSPKIKAMVAAMQGHLSFELSKTKRQYKTLVQEIAQKGREPDPQFVDNSKFSFISDPVDTSSVIYDSRGNLLRYEEVRCDNDSQYEHIYKNVLEVARIMKDFEEVSLEQGCLVDRIDINISATMTTVKKANFDLKVADDLLRKDLGDRILKWLIVANLIIFVVLLLKVFKPWK
jgi:hypothetical protein